MPRWRRCTLAAIPIALLASAGGWYLLSPWWTLWRIEEAARDRDAASFVRHVDLQAIDQQWRVDGRAFWGSVLHRVRRDTEAGRRFRAFARKSLVQIERQRSVGLEDLRPWLSRIPVLPTLRHDRFRTDEPYIIRYGLSRFELRYRDSSWEFGPVLTFRREGLA